jgi:hypothetical protein
MQATNSWDNFLALQAPQDMLDQLDLLAQSVSSLGLTKLIDPLAKNAWLSWLKQYFCKKKSVTFG